MLGNNGTRPVRYGHFVRVIKNKGTCTYWGYMVSVLLAGYRAWQVRGLEERTHCHAIGPVVWGYKTNRRWNEDL